MRTNRLMVKSICLVVGGAAMLAMEQDTAKQVDHQQAMVRLLEQIARNTGEQPGGEPIFPGGNN